MKTWETPRGRPVSIAAVPEFCPLCGYPVGRERFEMHAIEEHSNRVGWLVKYVREMPAAKIPALLIEQGSVRIYAVLLRSPFGGEATMRAEIFSMWIEKQTGPGYRFETAIASS